MRVVTVWCFAGAIAVSSMVTPSWGKDKRVLPPYVLAAHTVAVLVDPSAGVSIEDPRANQVAQKDVETKLLEWGRYSPVMGAQQADLLIVIRRGNGKLVNDTISDGRQNDRAGVINPTNNGSGVGVQHGQQPPLVNGGDPIGGRDAQGGGAHPQAEVGHADDEFAVYQGGVPDPMNGAPVWRWVRKDGLKPHDVPAVEEFRKAVAETEKALAAAQQKKP